MSRVSKTKQEKFTVYVTAPIPRPAFVNKVCWQHLSYIITLLPILVINSLRNHCVKLVVIHTYYMPLYTVYIVVVWKLQCNPLVTNRYKPNKINIVIILSSDIWRQTSAKCHLRSHHIDDPCIYGNRLLNILYHPAFNNIHCITTSPLSEVIPHGTSSSFTSTCISVFCIIFSER